MGVLRKISLSKNAAKFIVDLPKSSRDSRTWGEEKEEETLDTRKLKLLLPEKEFPFLNGCFHVEASVTRL